MHILLVTEIWGRTPHVDDLAESIRPAGGQVTVIDPYAGSDPGFRDQDEAYAAFLRQCGHEAYARRVRKVLLEAEEPVFLAGFSAGAGAVWSVVCAQDTGHARHAACFYGSAIRTMAERMPQVPVDLVFPEHEPHFDVTALVGVLGRKPLVDCRVVPEGHGFMNPLSERYDEAAARHWTAWLKGKIESVAGQFPAGG